MTPVQVRTHLTNFRENFGRCEYLEAQLTAEQNDALALEDMKKELLEKSTSMRFVKAWLSGLREKDQWILERFYIDQLSMPQIEGAYTERFGVSLTLEGLHKRKRMALQQVYNIAR